MIEAVKMGEGREGREGGGGPQRTKMGKRGEKLIHIKGLWRTSNELTHWPKEDVQKGKPTSSSASSSWQACG